MRLWNFSFFIQTVKGMEMENILQESICNRYDCELQTVWDCEGNLRDCQDCISIMARIVQFMMGQHCFIFAGEWETEESFQEKYGILIAALRK